MLDILTNKCNNVFMNKTKNGSRTVYGVSFKNHGSWTKPTSLTTFSKTTIKRISGLSRTASLREHLNQFASYAATVRKQPAKLIKIS
jgi:hypothetical protein